MSTSDTSPAPIPPNPIADWLNQLYGHADAGWLSLFSVDRADGERHVDWAPAADPAAMVHHIEQRNATGCVWLGVGTRKANLGKRRGGADDCLQIPGFSVDIDIAGPGHKTDAPLPADRAQAHALIERFPLPPTAVVDSGGGLQPWWLFPELADVDDDTAAHLTAWGATWKRLANEAGFHLDNIFDVARVLRVPGTINRKEGLARPVTLVAANFDRRYGFDDLEQHLDPPPKPPEPSTRSRAVPYIGPERPGDAFNASHTAADVLSAAGFTLARRHHNGEEHWVRPGKDARDGTSATVYPDDGHCTIWSDTCKATWPHLELRRPYDPFGLYAAINHSGDWGGARRALQARGYGSTDRDVAGDVIGESLRPTRTAGRTRGQVDAAPAGPRDRPWPEPTPLPEEITPPAMPDGVFPPWMLDYARSVARQNQVADDLPLILALGALAAVLNGHVLVEPTPGWEEGVNVWLLALAEAGGSKSPVAKAMQKPAREFEKKTIRWAADALAQYEQKHALLEKRAKAADDAYLRDGDQTHAAEALRLAAEARDLVRPPAGEIFAGDITMEALVRLLHRNNEHGAIADTEGSILSIAAGRYSKQANADVLLRTWGGDNHQHSRSTGEVAFELEDPRVAMTLTVQPGRWARVLANEELVEVGFPDRFMMAMVPRTVGSRTPDLRRQRIDEGARDTYHSEFLAVADRYRSFGTVKLTLDDDAIDAFDAMRQAHEPRMVPGGDLNDHRTFIAKLHPSIVRTAGLLHVAWGHTPNEPIDGVTMAQALALGDYWLDHHLGSMVDAQALSDARLVIEWAADGEPIVAASDLNRGMRIFRSAGGAERRSEALLLLQDHGLVRAAGGWPLDTTKQGRKVEIEFHPSVVAPRRDPGHSGNFAPESVEGGPINHRELQGTTGTTNAPISKKEASSSSSGIDGPPSMPDARGIGATGATDPSWSLWDDDPDPSP